MTWIRKFIDSYDAIESESQYDYRRIYEDDNTLQVLKGIETGNFIGEGLSRINLSKDSDEFDIEQTIPKIVRLLKAADNKTITGGRNYLEEFANIPNINEILLQIKKSESCKKMFAEAKVNIENGTLPHHPKTKREMDKEYAENTLYSQMKNEEGTEHLQPKDIVTSTLKSDITRQEINGVVKEIRETQIKDLQVAHEK